MYFCLGNHGINLFYKEMKKILFTLFMAITLASCEGPMGPQGPAGENAKETLWDEDTFEIRPNEWKIYDDGNDFYFYHERKWDALTEFAVDHGIVVCYLYKEKMDEYTLLEESVHNLIVDPTGTIQWTETISLSFSVGRFVIIVRNSDFFNEAPRDTKRFRMAVIQ